MFHHAPVVDGDAGSRRVTSVPAQLEGIRPNFSHSSGTCHNFRSNRLLKKPKWPIAGSAIDWGEILRCDRGLLLKYASSRSTAGTVPNSSSVTPTARIGAVRAANCRESAFLSG